MRHSLLLLGVIAALAIGAPAYSQYLYMDVGNGGPGNGIWTSADVLTSASTQVDIYLNTNHNRAGTTILCPDGTNPLNIGSYDLMIHNASVSGSVTYGTWTNAMTGYGQVDPPLSAGPDFGVGFSSASAFNVPGLYKLGTLAVTVTGTPILTFLTTQPAGLFGTASLTAFGSQCSGSTYPNTIALGVDFFDADGTASATPVESTTWGKIKQLYH